METYQMTQTDDNSLNGGESPTSAIHWQGLAIFLPLFSLSSLLSLSMTM